MYIYFIEADKVFQKRKGQKKTEKYKNKKYVQKSVRLYISWHGYNGTIFSIFSI